MATQAASAAAVRWCDAPRRCERNARAFAPPLMLHFTVLDASAPSGPYPASPVNPLAAMSCPATRVESRQHQNCQVVSYTSILSYDVHFYCNGHISYKLVVCPFTFYSFSLHNKHFKRLFFNFSIYSPHNAFLEKVFFSRSELNRPDHNQHHTNILYAQERNPSLIHNTGTQSDKTVFFSGEIFIMLFT